MTSRSRILLVAGLLAAAGLALGLTVALTGGRGSTTPAAGRTSPPPRGAAGAAHAFERFAGRCLVGDPDHRCPHAAAVLLGYLNVATARTSVRASRVVRLCTGEAPPPRCSQKAVVLAQLRALRAALVDYTTRVKAAYDVTPIAPSGPAVRPEQRTTLTGSVAQTDRTWVCDRPVRLDSVSVTITPNAPRHQGVGIRLEQGCTGTIGSIDVVTSIGDGVDVHGGHDLTIDGGSIACNEHGAQAHQDGIQATAGSDIVFRHVTVDCRTANNSAFYVNAIPGRPSVPHRILFLDGHLSSTLSSTAFIGRHQTESGVRNSVVCPSRYFTFRTGPAARAVDENNSFPAACS
jgi:hypothetical protein